MMADMTTRTTSKKKVLFISFSMMHHGIDVISKSISGKYDPELLIFLDFGDFEIVYDQSHKKSLDLKKICKLCSGFDYVAVSANSMNKRIAFLLCDSIKKKTGAKVILGGYLGITEPEESIRHCDYVCVWEGEYLSGLLDAIESGKNPDILVNFISKDPAAVTILKSADFNGKKNWDNPGIAQYKRYYFYKDGDVSAFSDFRSSRFEIQTIRGCAHNCTFCSNFLINDIKDKNHMRRVQKKDMHKLLGELCSVPEHCSRITIVDDNFFLRSEVELHSFVNEYLKHNKDKELNIEVDMRSADFLRKLREVSRIPKINVSTGIQSGSERFRKEIYNRDISDKRIIGLISGIGSLRKRRPALNMIYEFITMNPLEKENDLIDTINLMLKLDGKIFVYAYVNFPRTSISFKKNNEYIMKRTDFAHSGKSDCSNGSGFLFSVSNDEFNRFPYYYFYMNLISVFKKNGLGFLLPKKYEPGIFSDLLNMRIFSGIYSSLIRLSYIRGQAGYTNSIRKELEMNYMFREY